MGVVVEDRSDIAAYPAIWVPATGAKGSDFARDLDVGARPPVEPWSGGSSWTAYRS